MNLALILLGSLASPLFLLVIEKILPYPYILEEILKLIFVLLYIGQEKVYKTTLFNYVILSGLLFAFSESIFFLTNILALQTYNIFFLRLVLTSILHATTISVIYFCSKRTKYGWLLGLLLAMVIHYIYNSAVMSFQI